MCVKAEEKAESKSKADDEEASDSHPKAQPVMLAAMPPSAPADKPVVLASAPGKCCYSGPKDCDSEEDWCSKDATHCDKCTGTFYNATDLDLAEVAEPIMLAAKVPKVHNVEAPAHCCYSGRKDCDGSRDWCSKDESHCTKCGGTFHADEEPVPAAPSKHAAPLMLAANVPKVHNAEAPGHCCYSGRKDCDSSRDWCSKDESHCTRCGGTFHANEEAAPAAPSKAAAVAQKRAWPLELAAVSNATDQQAGSIEREPREQRQQQTQAEQAEQPEQPEELAQGQQQGDWGRYIPKGYRHFFGSKKEDAHRDATRSHTEASRAKATAFLGAQTESLTSNLFLLPALACLTISGLGLLTTAVVSANRRTVILQTEVLG